MTTPYPTEPSAQPTEPAAATMGEQQPQEFHNEAPAERPEKLSLFLKISIILLAALSIAAISLLFIGDFDGKFVRIFSTFVIFAVFVLLTALDTRLDRLSNWYAPVALIANSYILALVLIVTWMTDYEPFFLGWEIFWKAFVVILVTRVVILCCQLLLGLGEKRAASLNIFAFATSILAIISGILFTAPAAIETFDVTIPELYWRIAVATLMLTALGLSITLLLNWSYGAADREAARAARQAQQLHPQQLQPQHLQPQGVTGASYVAAPPASQVGYYGAGYGTAQQPMQQAPMEPQPMEPQPMQQQAPMQQPQPQQWPAQPQELLPWPTFADGSPLPAGPDGQPDFSALEQR